MKKILVVSIMALLCSAHGFAQKSYQEFRDAQARVGDGVAEIHVKPMVVEVEPVKFDGSERMKKDYPLDANTVAGLGGDIANIRAWVTYMATEDVSSQGKGIVCDIIMNPLFKIVSDTNKKDGSLVVTIVGYPGKFVNWHTATSADFDWLAHERMWRKDTREVIAPVVSE